MRRGSGARTMPEIIRQVGQNAPLVLLWYAAGSFASFAVTLGVATWIVGDARWHREEATLWTLVAALASVLAIPALLARLHDGFANEMRESLVLFAYVS